MDGGTGPGRGGRGVDARRRLIAALVVLLVLALLIPLTCQALLGSNEDAAQEREQRSDDAGTAAGAGTEDEGDTGTSNAGEGDEGEPDAGTAASTGTEDEGDTGEGDAGEGDEGEPGTQDDSSGRGAPFVDDRSSSENGDEAAPDLLAFVTPQAAVNEEEAAAGEDQGSAGSAPDSSVAGGEPHAEEQPISENQFALAAPPEQQPTPTRERAPTRRSGPADAAPVAEPAANSRGDRIRARADRLVAASVPEPDALEKARARQAAAETVVPAPVEVAPAPVEVAPAPVEVAPAPVEVAPAPVVPAAQAAPVPVAGSRGPAVSPIPARGALDGGDPSVPALPAGPRLAAPGPSGTPGPKVF